MSCILQKITIVRKIARIFPILLFFPIFGFAAGNFSPSELDTLVSNIALYPDPLLVHVLTASTYGEQIPHASAWAESHSSLKGEMLSTAIENANLTYDPSVQALLPFPSVLSMMAKYATWTDQLGDAVTTQKDDVMEAVQRMRQSAYDHGHLQTTEQVKVEESSGNISINPVRTEIVYVPVYNPRVVYYVYADGYTRISYGTGIWLGTWFGEWGWGSCWFDWGPRVIYVRNTRWYAHRPIPHHPRRYMPPPRHGPGVTPPPAPKPAPRIHTESTALPQKAPASRVPESPKPAPVTNRPDTRAAAAAAPRSERMVVPSNSRPAEKVPQNVAPREERVPAFGNARPVNSNGSTSRSGYGSGSSTVPGSYVPPASGNTSSRGSGSYNSSNDDRNSGSSRGSGRNSSGFGKAVRR